MTDPGVGNNPPPPVYSPSGPDAYQYLETPPGNTNTRYPHGTISRAQILQRAQSWLNEKVPYSEVAWWTDHNGTYRQDCSGYVSMAWGLNQDIDFWTGNLNTVSHVIDQSELLPGDILLSASHTVIFAGWANAGHTLFDYYEESHPGTDARFVVDAPLSRYLVNGFTPFQYDGVTGGDTALPANPPTGLSFTALQAGMNVLAPNGNMIAEPPPASWQAGYQASGTPEAQSSTPAKAAAPDSKPQADAVDDQVPLSFAVGAAGAIFLVAGAVIARGGPRLATSAARHRRRRH
ncbi:MAG TPA: hypothetical protein VHF26_16860 [Trebonia sp.]|nr:hypothetical protein [Trebonia sp.]